MIGWWRAWRFSILFSLVLNLVLISLVGRLSLKDAEPDLECHPSKPVRRHHEVADANVTKEMRRLRDMQEQRITDLVMPFHEGQLDRVAENLQTWRQHPPCSSMEIPWRGEGEIAMDNEGFYTFNGQLGREVMLTFALSGPYNATVETALNEIFNNLPSHCKCCFRGVQVYFADFRGNANAYMEATRSLFENFIYAVMPLKDPYYALYMEPDMLPVRKHWLSALDALTRYPSSPFWIRGSLYRGRSREVLKLLHNAIHINGNAIYNLRDPKFKAYYSSYVRKSNDAYDVDLIKPLLDSELFNQTSQFAHKLQYTDAIWNLWHSIFSLSELLNICPGLYMIHGGERKS